MGVAEGSMAEARFFKLSAMSEIACVIYPTEGRRQAPVSPGENERSPEIGTIIRKYFPRDARHPCDLTKAWSARQHLLTARTGPQRLRTVPNPADFRCETGQWQGFNGPDSAQKIPNLKAFPLRFFDEFHQRRDHGHRCVLIRESGRTGWRRLPTDGEGAGAPRQAAPPDPDHDRRQLRHRCRHPAALRACRHDTVHDRPGLCRCRPDL